MRSLASSHGCQGPPRELTLPCYPSHHRRRRLRHPHRRRAAVRIPPQPFARPVRWGRVGPLSGGSHSRSVRDFVSYFCKELMQCSTDSLLSPQCKHEHEPSTAVTNTNLNSPTPHTLVPLVYPLSTTAKRDVVGRKPRQKMYGVAVYTTRDRGDRAVEIRCTYLYTYIHMCILIM